MNPYKFEKPSLQGGFSFYFKSLNFTKNNNMAGIDKVKKVLDVVIGISNDTGKALEDGKFEGKEALAYLDDLMKIPNIVSDLPALKEQFKDIDASEREELIEYAKVQFDIPQDRIEAIVESSLLIAYKLIDIGFDVVELAKAIKNKPIDTEEL